MHPILTTSYADGRLFNKQNVNLVLTVTSGVAFFTSAASLEKVYVRLAAAARRGHCDALTPHSRQIDMVAKRASLCLPAVAALSHSRCRAS
jgi:hypothetical protein